MDATDLTAVKPLGPRPGEHRSGAIAVVLVCCTALLAGATPIAASPSPSSTQVPAQMNDDKSATFDIAGKRLRLDESELELLRGLAVSALELDKTHQSFAAELRQSNLWRFGEASRFGQWIFELRDGSVALVRHPPRSAVMRMVVITFARLDETWKVHSISDDRVQAAPQR